MVHRGGKKSALENQDAPETKDQCSWTLDNETHLIRFITTSQARGGDGMNFSKTFWTSVSTEMAKHTTQGAPKTPEACQQKWTRLCTTFSIADSVATNSGWEYSLENGANITAASEMVWTDWISKLEGCYHCKAIQE
ncbi:hypothetical protein AZE42_10116 [Rhizopogon vesiculosus]|uniref:Myb/SANT-like DNA-binding domain-containing protein n=1 Tax=Rhizopogon vesiculosus TaxID=180088 RepID=A0A1J8Q8K9_9AGAM|nr:hypothetical protein AZE42_10116 [Rhizopogon vesiculosus]